MGEAIRKESSMEDILASIRKIISSDLPDTASPDDTSEDATDNSADKNSLLSAPAPAPVTVQEPVKAELEANFAPKVEQAKSSQIKTSMSSTLEGIRAAVGKKKPADAASVIAEPKAVPKAPKANVSNAAKIKPVSTSATPLAPSISGEKAETAKPVDKSVASLSDLADTIKADGAGKRTNDMNYGEPETKVAKTVGEKTEALPDTESTSNLNAPTASELNFKAFANSVEKPANTLKAPSEFVSDDISVFAKDDGVSVDISSDDLRGPLDDTTVDSPVDTTVDSTPVANVAVSDMAAKPEQANSPVNASISANITDSIKAVVHADADTSGAVDNLQVNQVAPQVEPQGKPLGETSKFKEALVSPSTKAAVTGSINRLKQSMDDVNSAHVESVLRPMLREWLDNNLPDMVERVVREEISRITQKTDK